MVYIILAVIAAFAVYAFIENKLLLRVRREELGGNIKAVHLSDLHKRRFGRDNSRLCKAVERESPDIIIFSGDLVSRTETDFSAIKRTLDSLCRIAPVYMIMGNHEQSLPSEMQKEFLQTVSETEAVLLRNETVSLDIKGRDIAVCGLLEDYEVYKKDGGYRDLEKITTGSITALLGEKPGGEVLLMAHNPFFGEAYAEWGADWVFSGHVHGGIVRLFGKAMLSPERKLFPKNAKGVYKFGRTRLLVSAGLGKLRLFNPPEIVVYMI
ncbi:metallophosphoesterase [uncultured Ruminococcus sp.]|uniref:metallophosphoesterase n=1 Tax=uncultured Ruminococcus sp. TaxID=165186 RepID=UPI00260B49F3|nr:metallophosphoesterase [uncultured Ruminococcus sp.]